MEIQLIPTAQHVTTAKVNHRIAVVFDVLRSTTCMITALADGAKGIFPALNTLEAEEKWLKVGKENSILAGEAYGDKIPHFDLGNSPLEYSSEVVQNKYIVLTTTNGTQALRKAVEADVLLVGSFLNITAMADFVRDQGKDLALICAGTQGRFSLEDTLAAGMLIFQLHRKSSDLQLTDLGLAAEALYRAYRDNLLVALSSTENGRKLKNQDQCADLRYCARVNEVTAIPYWNQGVIQLLKA